MGQGQKMLAERKMVDEVAKYLEVTPSTGTGWRTSTEDMKADDAKQLKELEEERAALEKERGW